MLGADGAFALAPDPWAGYDPRLPLSEFQQGEGGDNSSLGSGRSSGGMLSSFAGGNNRAQTASSGGRPRTTEAGSSRGLKALKGRRSAGVAPRRGALSRGTTRALVESSAAHTRVTRMLGQLDENNRELEMQRMEIRRL